MSATIHSDLDAMPEAVPIQKAFQSLAVSPVTGYERFVQTGKLETFTVGSRRYTTRAAMSRLIKGLIKETAEKEAPELRAAKVAPAVAGRAKAREEARKKAEAA